MSRDFGYVAIINKIVAYANEEVDANVDSVATANTVKDRIRTSLTTEKFDEIKENLDQLIDSETDKKPAEIVKETWRPVMMYLFIAIISIYLVGGWILNIFWPAIILLTIPDAVWTVITVIGGGYVVGRSGEKIAEKWKEK